MEIGISSYAFRWAAGQPGFVPAHSLTPIALLEKSAALGAQVVQLCENVLVEPWSDCSLDELMRRARQLGLALEIGIEGTTRARLTSAITVAGKLDAHLVRVVLEDAGRAPSIAQIVPTLCDLVPALHAADITLAIENHFALSPSELVTLVRMVDDPSVGICLDPLNTISRLVGPAETVAALAPYTVSVHAKDGITKRLNTGFYVSGCPLGTGLVDLPGLLAALDAAKRSPNLLVEAWMDRLEDDAATLAQEEIWVRDGIAYLKNLIYGRRSE